MNNNFLPYQLKKNAEQANMLSANIGTMSNLQTTHKDSLVNAINDNATSLVQTLSNQGDLTQLNTIDKSSFVNALKEIKSQANSNQTSISNIGNASPKGIYASLSALQTAFPTGTTGIYLVTADGKWYYWSGSAWTAGGTYQSTGIPNGSITPTQLSFLPLIGTIGKNLFNLATVATDAWIDGNNGNNFTSTGYFASDYISVSPNTQYAISPTAYDSRVSFYDSNKNYLSRATDGSTSFATPSNCSFIKIGSRMSWLNTTQVELGSTPTYYEAYGTFLSLATVRDNSFPATKLQNNSVGYKQLAILPVVGTPSKNLFDQTAITANNYLNNATGIPFSLTNYFVSDFTPVSANTQYTISPIASDTRSVFYDSNKSFLSATADNVATFTTPSGAAYVRFASRNTLLTSTQFELGGTATSYASYGAKVTSDSLSNVNVKKAPIYKLNDAWTQWLKGNKFPIAFYGDSTVDGVNTTGWVGNTLGVDSTSPNTFSKNLENTLRGATNNNILRIYNAGFSGQKADWGFANISAEFTGSSAYNDVKMIGIGFGINDRLSYTTYDDYRNGFKTNIKAIIDWCYSNNIQPFLITTQAIVEPGVATSYAGTYPLRTSEAINSIANEVKRELAKEYGIDLIDLNKFTEMFLIYSSYPTNTLIPDRLHFGDIGHKYESDVLFSQICPRAVKVEDYTQIDYSNQRIADSVPEDWLTMPASPTDNFKVFVNYTKADSIDTKIMTAWVLINSKTKLTLKAYRNNSTSTYVKVNGVATTLTTPETNLGQLDMGLYKLEVFTGASTAVDFKGFIIQ